MENKTSHDMDDTLDPKEPGGRSARRFLAATFDDALATDGSIIQHKAARFARDRGLSFELGRLHGDSPTLIGATESILAANEEPRPDRRYERKNANRVAVA